MAEQRQYTAQLARKGLDTTGVTEDHARKMASNLGGYTILIIEAEHAKVTTDADGNQQVTLTATNVEPVPEHLEDQAREFQRALYRQRPAVAGQEALKGTNDGPTPQEAADQLTANVDRDGDGNVVGMWDGRTDGPLVAEDGGDSDPETGDDGDYAST